VGGLGLDMIGFDSMHSFEEEREGERSTASKQVCRVGVVIVMSFPGLWSCG
jgi:hypothetical protein